MLPPFIIDQIRRREDDERRRRDEARPRLDLPLDHYRPASDRSVPSTPGEDEPTRGVVILDLMT